MKLKHIIFFLIFIPIATLANNDPPLLGNDPYAIGLDLGVSKPTNLGNSTTFPVGYSTFFYGANTNDDLALVPGISIGKILTIAPFYTLQVGGSFHYISSMDISGNLAQGISPPYYQSTYSYSVESYQYLAEAKLRRQLDDNYFPYLYVGIGMASNRAYNYSTGVPNNITVTPSYSNNTTNSFSYSLGLGMDYSVGSKLSIGLGYEFIDLGKVGLGSGTVRNTAVGAKLVQSNLYMNTLVAQLTYFI